MLNRKSIIISLITITSFLHACKEIKKEMLVSTGEATNIQTNSADISGLIVDLGEGRITQFGHCWSKSPDVDLSSPNQSLLGSPTSTRAFTSQLTNLEGGTKYYVKAYITDGAIKVYGKEISFTTIEATIPTLTTTTISVITAFSARSGGIITSDGGATVTAQGVCWNTSSMPTISNFNTSEVILSGVFTSAITGMNPATTYYVRAYATNSAGTAYGNEISFTTLPPATILDIDGNVYTSITIGTQTWLRENLQTTKYNNGDLIGTTTPANKEIGMENTPKYQWPCNGTESLTDIYGRLYSGYTVSDSRKLCPVGWHVPSDDEWTILTDYLGGINVAGGKLKENVTRWLPPNTGATNESGFTALPGVYRSGSLFYNFGQWGMFWTATENSSAYHFHRTLGSDAASVYRGYFDNYAGLSVRCLKN